MKSLIFSFFFLFTSLLCFAQNQIDLSKYSKKQQAIIKSVQEQINFISARENNYLAVNDTLAKSLTLFSEDALVLAESLSEDVPMAMKKEIKEYLTRIKLLKYSEISITDVVFDKKDKITSIKVIQGR